MFSKSRPTSKGGSAGSKAGSGGFSVIGADVAISGNISAEVDLHIDGIVEGDIACTSLIQGESSRITGSVMANSARLAGTVNGSIIARELIVERTAHIIGDVSYETIAIAAGAQIEGRFTLRGGALIADNSDGQLKLVTAAE